MMYEYIVLDKQKNGIKVVYPTHWMKGHFDIVSDISPGSMMDEYAH